MTSIEESCHSSILHCHVSTWKKQIRRSSLATGSANNDINKQISGHSFIHKMKFAEHEWNVNGIDSFKVVAFKLIECRVSIKTSQK